MSIKLLAEDDRPREKFLLKGKSALSDSELLAIIMGSGSREVSAVDLARNILQHYSNSWHALGLASIADLMKFKGIGEAKAISIGAALEIGRRRAAQSVPEKPKISSSNDAYQILFPHLSDLRTEEFWAIFLNQNNRVIQCSRLTQGGITGSIVDVRILFRTALEHYATGIIIAHNHPSGNLQPSRQDLEITKRIHELGKAMDIQLLDHLIIAQQAYYSFKDEGNL